MSKVLFPRRPDSHPMIYAYEENNPRYEGLLKVGYTTIGVEKRVAQQYPTKRPDETPYRIVFAESAMYKDKKPRYIAFKNWYGDSGFCQNFSIGSRAKLWRERAKK